MIRFAVVKAADDDIDGVHIQTGFIRGTNKQVKDLLNQADVKPLYMVRVTMRPGVPGYFDWFTAQLGLDFDIHAGNA
jgi:hypothetical protein